MAEDRILFQQLVRWLGVARCNCRSLDPEGFSFARVDEGQHQLRQNASSVLCFRVVVVVSSSSSRVDRQNASCGFVLVRLEMLESSSNEQTQLGFPQSLKQQTECVPRLARSTRVQADNHRNHTTLFAAEEKVDRGNEDGKDKTRHPRCHLAEQIALARPLFSPASANRSPGQASDPPPTAACSPRKFARDRPRHWSRPQSHSASANIVRPDPLISATSMLRLGPSRS